LLKSYAENQLEASNMGILADFFVATPADALEYESLLMAQEPLPESFFRAEYKGFTSLELGFLWAILEQTEWDVAKHGLEHVAHGEEGETWLERFPEEFVGFLAALTNETVIAERWAEHEELACGASDLIPVLLDLQRLAIQARDSQKSMYLWGSL
jgi:hypothetical protein